MAKRPPVPAELERQVLIESGHRCAIHTCRQTPVEIAHITAWSRCKTHEFHNLICLCPTCHTRYDNGQIDRRSMMAYKLAAWWRNSRFSDLERRMISLFIQDGTDEAWILCGLKLLLSQVIEDGLITETVQTRPGDFPETFREALFKLTPNGRALVEALRAQTDEIFGA